MCDVGHTWKKIYLDLIASPTLCLTPPLMSEVADADSLWVNRRIVRNTVAVNYLGLCAITMPVGCDRAGMPVGLELTASADTEERLLAAERVLGTDTDRLRDTAVPIVRLLPAPVPR